jgi:hypothetical protein
MGDMTTWYILAHRKSASILGAAAAPLKGSDGETMVFVTLEGAMAMAAHYNRECTSKNVYYTVDAFGRES